MCSCRLSLFPYFFHTSILGVLCSVLFSYVHFGRTLFRTFLVLGSVLFPYYCSYFFCTSEVPNSNSYFFRTSYLSPYFCRTFHSYFFHTRTLPSYYFHTSFVLYLIFKCTHGLADLHVTTIAFINELWVHVVAVRLRLLAQESVESLLKWRLQGCSLAW